MSNFSIGMSGLDAAQRALDVIGNNIANAATEGYHRQRIELSPAYSTNIGGVFLGGGVDFEGVTRVMDGLLEQEILRQASSLEHVSQEDTTLRMVESVFGELSSSSGLNAAINEFFNAMDDLSAHPAKPIWQNQAVSAAETMAARFRTLGQYLTTLESQIVLEAQNTIEQVNSLASRIAKLNDNIQRIEIGDAEANNLRDERDQCISELSELVGVQIQNREYGVVDVNVAGIAVVAGATTVELETGLQEDGKYGIGIAGSYNYNADIQGGRLGGLLSLKNQLLTGFHNQLDDLAAAIILQVNQIHVQGVGSEGSFTEITGWVMASEVLADFEPPVTDGSIFIRVTDASTGQVTRNEIDIDVSSDTLTTVAAKIAAVTGLDASVNSSRLSITADAGYEIDFLPAVLPSPTNSDLTGTTSPPTMSVSGIYAGQDNDTFTFTVVGTGDVGNGTLQLLVTDGDADTVATLNIGSGYAAQDMLEVGDSGIRISLTAGDLVDGNTFEVDVYANTDTSGVLTATGINTFFSGSSASDIAVCSDITDSPGRIATALGAELTDNTNSVHLAELREQALSSLNNMTVEEFYRHLVSDIAQTLSIKQMTRDSTEVLLQDLGNQQGDISGVNINEEAARLLVFQQMFQAMAKYLATVQSSISAVMEIV